MLFTWWLRNYTGTQQDALAEESQKWVAAYRKVEKPWCHEERLLCPGHVHLFLDTLTLSFNKVSLLVFLSSGTNESLPETFAFRLKTAAARTVGEM